MKEFLTSKGGLVTSLDDMDCTHIVSTACLTFSLCLNWAIKILYVGMLSRLWVPAELVAAYKLYKDEDSQMIGYPPLLELSAKNLPTPSAWSPHSLGSTLHLGDMF